MIKSCYNKQASLRLIWRNIVSLYQTRPKAFGSAIEGKEHESSSPEDWFHFHKRAQLSNMYAELLSVGDSYQKS